MKRLIPYLFTLASLNFSCIFSHDEPINLSVIVGNYSVSSFAGYNSLEYKDSKSNVGNIILMNVDSIGWHQTKILAVYKNEYFLIDTLSKKSMEKYKNYNDLLLSHKEINIMDFNLKGLPSHVR